MAAQSNNAKILIVDDEPDIIEMLQYNLRKEGYELKTADNGKKAVEVAKEFQPNLILMDIMMPVMDGVEACRQIREVPALRDVFVVFLTARSEEYSEVAAFDVGADDFINKPIKPRALMSRISAILRRNTTSKDNDGRIEVGDLVIDKGSYSVIKNGETIVFPKKEFELLHFLAKNPNKVFGRDDLLHYIWGADVYVLSRTVDVHIRKLREKIGENYIHTTKGVGYRFEYVPNAAE
ncbi:two-component system, OmpR family, alkaline phosphatase synthesis response regulator PhoP [Flexibacter flexilis DSM 6793]|uniref:Phosphate regulon transcriptional regulatory protein PhoB n=1 Tax=Flexibacter flexilis DSM 6793 TaxID=927664 RepID=A0A1I1H853_9BACT|nr:response regulator transcription factor [Flexibacter flexilis]SFC20187.1 two-component system, OmpR family, alkaline phosphatase synthesis response regulator PhoP [Flexibacter flexilis DSM 6793]